MVIRLQRPRRPARPTWLGPLLAVWATGFSLETPAQTAAGNGPRAPVDGRRLFLKNCAPCHGADGTARTPAARKLGVKDLTVNRLEDAQIRTQIREGVQATGSSGKMPAFRESFGDEELAALVSEVKRLRKPGRGG